MKEELERIREWAQEKAQGGSEPPWAWYQYMKLIETCDSILSGMESTITTENSQRSVSRRDGHLRLVDSIYQQESVPHHHAEQQVQMPM